MKNQPLQRNIDFNLNRNEFSPEDFSEINQIVETLITSIENNKKGKSRAKRPLPRKKWKKKPKKEKNVEIGIRELPFTF